MEITLELILIGSVFIMSLITLIVLLIVKSGQNKVHNENLVQPQVFESQEPVVNTMDQIPQALDQVSTSNEAMPIQQNTANFEMTPDITNEMSQPVTMNGMNIAQTTQVPEFQTSPTELMQQTVDIPQTIEMGQVSMEPQTAEISDTQTSQSFQTEQMAQTPEPVVVPTMDPTFEISGGVFSDDQTKTVNIPESPTVQAVPTVEKVQMTEPSPTSNTPTVSVQQPVQGVQVQETIQNVVVEPQIEAVQAPVASFTPTEPQITVQATQPVETVNLEPEFNQPVNPGVQFTPVVSQPQVVPDPSQVGVDSDITQSGGDFNLPPVQ